MVAYQNKIKKKTQQNISKFSLFNKKSKEKWKYHVRVGIQTWVDHSGLLPWLCLALRWFSCVKMGNIVELPTGQNSPDMKRCSKPHLKDLPRKPPKTQLWNKLWLTKKMDGWTRGKSVLSRRVYGNRFPSEYIRKGEERGKKKRKQSLQYVPGELHLI